MKRKGQIWVSVVLYTLIIVVTTLLILNAGLPLIDSIKERNYFSQMENVMTNVNKHIRDIASEGQGSQRVLSVSIPEGDFEAADDRLGWRMDTKTKIIEARSSIDKGDLKIRSNADIDIEVTNETYVLENKHIIVNFSRVGNKSSWKSIETVGLINSITYKKTGGVTGGNFTFTLNNDENGNSGNGYSIIEDTSDEQGSVTYVAHLNTSSYEYDLKLTLESEADFLSVALGDTRIK